MLDDSQNSSGFFKTQMISKASLLSGISNFDFDADSSELFADSDLELPDRLMLGKRAERYFSEWIKRSSLYELVAENVQITEEKQTLGEFDFVVKRKRDNQLIHIELIYKFYLFDPTIQGTEFEKWIGPNRGDRLDLKLSKLKDHQFPLLQSQCAQNRLRELGIAVSEIKQEVLFLANLFIPRNQEVVFDRINKAAIEGSWMKLDEWKQHANSENRYAIPDKINWFARDLKTTGWFSKDEAFERIKFYHGQKQSPLVWTKGLEGNQSRNFVVWW